MSDSVVNRQLLTVREAAGHLRISERQVRRLVRSDELPALRLGRKGRAVRIDPDELERWLEVQR